MVNLSFAIKKDNTVYDGPDKGFLIDMDCNKIYERVEIDSLISEVTEVINYYINHHENLYNIILEGIGL